MATNGGSFSCLVKALAIACAVFGAGRAGAQEVPMPGRMESLSAFVAEVVRTNPGVREARLQWLIRTGQARAEWGVYEPTLAASAKEQGLRQQNTALEQFQQLGTQVYDEKNDAYSLAVEGNLPTGANYNVGASITRLQDTYVEQGQFKSFIGVSAQQPLLKGLTHGAPQASIRSAFEDRIIAFHEYRRQLMAAVTQAETAYWNLAFAQQVLRMDSDSVKVAQDLLQTAREAALVGRMSDLDVREAEAELASREATREDGELSLNEALRQLRLLVGGSRQAESQGMVAADPLVADEGRQWDAAAEGGRFQEWAQRAQPDYMIESEQVQKENVLVGLQKDQALPELNLTGSYGYTGLGGTPQDSLDILGSQSYPTWTVGLELRMPLLLGVKQRNDLEVEELKRELAAVRLAAIRQQMTDTIASLVQGIATLRAHVDNQHKVVEVKRDLLDVQTARLREGTAGLLEVYNAEDALRQARQRELEAVVRYRRAMMDLERASGSVLRDRGLEDLKDGQVVLSEALRSPMVN
jgi:outer membrane protein